MKRRPMAPEQGSMLILMEPKAPSKKARLPEPAITKLVYESSTGNVLELSHEPVQDPLDDPEEEAAFVAYYGDYNHG